MTLWLLKTVWNKIIMLFRLEQRIDRLSRQRWKDKCKTNNVWNWQNTFSFHTKTCAFGLFLKRVDRSFIVFWCKIFVKLWFIVSWTIELWIYFSPPLGLGQRNQTDVRASTGQNVLISMKIFFNARTLLLLYFFYL